MALPDAHADLVVTSPPYIGMIDYAHANRLCTLDGLALHIERMHEIGKPASAATGWPLRKNISWQMNAACAEIARVLEPGAFCAVVVVGASRKFPEAVRQTLALFEKEMVRAPSPTARHPSRRAAQPDRIAGEAIEYICVFRRP